jgi:flagellar hook capping protein FlgD
MRTSIGWRQVFESVCSGSARRPERVRSCHWLAVCGLAGVMALSLAASPSRGVAGETKTTLGSPAGDETPQLPEAGPAGGANSRYVPRLIGLERFRQHGVRKGGIQMGLGTEDCPVCDPLGVFDSTHFLKPTKIDNDWLPLKPGTQMILQGVANRGGGLLAHLVIFTVTDLIKRINGINCVVTWDQDIGSGVIQESELAFFAQSNEGDVWLSGEYPEEYDNGVFIGAENTWIHGVEDASAGVTVVKEPVVGSPGYREAIALENDFWDCGMVYSLAEAKHQHGHFDRDRDKDKGRGKDQDKDRDTLVIREWAPLDGCNVIQFKNYLEGVGVTHVGALDDPEGETLKLIEVRHLGRASMDSVRASALALDMHGPQVNEIYATTLPAFRAPHHGHGDDGDDDGDDLLANQPFGESAVAPSRTFMSIGPNPVSSSTGIAYGIARAGAVELSIFDVTGRKMRSLVSDTKEPGSYRVQWDGRDGAGRNVAGGVYFARLRAGAELVQRTIVVAR